VISGAESQVDSLDPQDLRLVVDVTNLPSGQLVFTPVVKQGNLLFEVKAVGPDRENERVFEIKARLESPYRLEIVSAAPDDISFVQR
jgi:hypothetical protein